MSAVSGGGPSRLALGLLLALGCVNLDRPEVTLLPDADPMDAPAADTDEDGPPDLHVVPEDMGETDLDPDSGGGGETPGEAPPPPLAPLGAACAAGTTCASGRCVDGLCCDLACVGACQACNVAGSEGRCVPIPAGQDPANECAEATGCGADGTCDGIGACRVRQAGTECAPARCEGNTETPASACDGRGTCVAGTSRQCPGGVVCQGGSCRTSCAADGDCQAGLFCQAGSCRTKIARGQPCASAAQCATGFCADGICCGSACTETCQVCNLAGSVGTCAPVPAGMDPRSVCPAEPVASCARDGQCNGAGACRLYPAGTQCGSSSCSAEVETPAARCNGSGTCTPQPTRSCGGYLCSGLACGTTCTGAAGCIDGYTCNGTSCVALPGPLLYWKLDEASGSTALDASGGARHGTYIGASGMPIASSTVAPLMFANPFSRAFSRSPRHAIRLAPLPPALRPAAGTLTVSAWFLTSSLDTDSGNPQADILNAANSYILRLRSGLVELTVRATLDGMVRFIQCQSTQSGLLDGRWHHAERGDHLVGDSPVLRRGPGVHPGRRERRDLRPGDRPVGRPPRRGRHRLRLGREPRRRPDL